MVARIEPPADQRAHGLRTLQCSSAGHLPPLLVSPDRQVRLLTSRAERLLGIEEPRLRTDHEVAVRPGETVLLVTDGLVEAGRLDIDSGLARLTGALRDLGGLSADALCDRLLTRVVPDRTDDDIAVLAVRVLPVRT